MRHARPESGLCRYQFTLGVPKGSWAIVGVFDVSLVALPEEDCNKRQKQTVSVLMENDRTTERDRGVAIPGLAGRG